MTRLTTKTGWGTMLSCLLCLSLVFWSVQPAKAHLPDSTSLQSVKEMVDDHGHAHGEQIDLGWAMHGHDHDAADHDHNSAIAVQAPSRRAFLPRRSAWHSNNRDLTSIAAPPLERPPRM